MSQQCVNLCPKFWMLIPQIKVRKKTWLFQSILLLPAFATVENIFCNTTRKLNVMMQFYGEWFVLSTVVKTASPGNLTFFLIKVFVFASLTRSAYILWLRCRNKKPLEQKRRNKENDALICCNENDGNENYLSQTLLPFFEKHHDPTLNLIYHEKDFYLGRRILDSI